MEANLLSSAPRTAATAAALQDAAQPEHDAALQQAPAGLAGLEAAHGAVESDGLLASTHGAAAGPSARPSGIHAHERPSALPSVMAAAGQALGGDEQGHIGQEGGASAGAAQGRPRLEGVAAVQAGTFVAAALQPAGPCTQQPLSPEASQTGGATGKHFNPCHLLFVVAHYRFSLCVILAGPGADLGLEEAALQNITLSRSALLPASACRDMFHQCGLTCKFTCAADRAQGQQGCQRPQPQRCRMHSLWRVGRSRSRRQLFLLLRYILFCCILSNYSRWPL